MTDDLEAAGVSLDTYVAVQAAVNEGYARDAVLARHDLDEDAWIAADSAWADRLVESTDSDGALIEEYDRRLVAVQDGYRRRVRPVDEDLSGWLSLLRHLQASPDPLAELSTLGLRSTDLFRLQRLWSARLAEEAGLRADLARTWADVESRPPPTAEALALDIEPRAPLFSAKEPGKGSTPLPEARILAPPGADTGSVELPPLLSDLPVDDSVVAETPLLAPKPAPAAPPPQGPPPAPGAAPEPPPRPATALPSFMRKTAESGPSKPPEKPAPAAGHAPSEKPASPMDGLYAAAKGPGVPAVRRPAPSLGDITAPPSASPLRAALPFLHAQAAARAAARAASPPQPPPLAPSPPQASAPAPPKSPPPAPAPPPGPSRAPVPAAPSAAAEHPSPAATPLTIEQYAALCAELAVFQGQADRIFGRYGLKGLRERLTADLAWKERLHRDPQARAHWQRCYQHYFAHFTRVAQQAPR